MQENKKKQILLVGNPNVGKSTVFNTLCNKKQKTGNYAGVTVASHSGNYTYKDQDVEVIDLPGSYSVYPSSEDEAIFSKYLIDEQKNYAGVVYILEALSLKRGLLLFQQIQDLGIPMILIVNQIDQAERRGITIDIQKFSQALGIKIIQTNAKEQIGIDAVREAVYNNEFVKTDTLSFETPNEHRDFIQKLAAHKGFDNEYKAWMSLSLGTDLGRIGSVMEQLNEADSKSLVPKRLQVQETVRRYQKVDKILADVIFKKAQFKELLTEKLDKVLVHKFWGYVVFLAILLIIFQSVFFLAEYPMNWIEETFSWLAAFTSEHLPEGPINSLISNGIVPGIGGIVVFAPQIGILLYFLYLLEDSGYMARVVFLMDRLLRPFGLNGKSIVPLVSGTACAIPAVISTRNIENVKERLLTILVTPFMTCSARLPVYSIIIGLIISEGTFLGIKYKALVLMGMYLLGFLVALFSAAILKRFIKSKGKTYLVMDLPAYKKPLFGYDFKMVLGKVWDFITGAGKIIFIVSIIIWFLSYFGPSRKTNEFVAADVHLDHSYLAKMGKGIEPVIAPLGYDWKMGVGILTSFVAREVFVGTMSTLYSLEDDAPEVKVIDKMRRDVKPNGEKVFSFATGISVLLFYAFAMQCVSTLAVVYRETKSWKWTGFQVVMMTGLAYFVSMIVYQILK
ncbi:ferrous iron transport protein B [Chryseobacterium bernardetii]|jgi:ferrous iron transport protein B|uniref:Ferrous iron transport protein B n=3 Tax=Chryseobacterium TaxID=59732 RepID=A0A543EB65_9FLAO|nr:MULTISPECIES: ferrous iron transport protein B [Chryseobacterium]MDR6371559.1 ferrous iron transport protein B [Chryseobacterium vietnamense]MDR6441937.1 ferrous iron transport protein B [Chryseobacterium bernardetii]MDR6459745.1 ferrous iron transport protein B [Chryseobacterium vietnamense]MDR6488220.1 ferrous iron transport protein B [Chryseobacterium vietnamense]TQM18815.1 ferrous iron transport protein B [Chryseobacterium aquifrigidense]